MSVTGFNRRRREMAAQRAAEEAARLKVEQEAAEEAARLEAQRQEQEAVAKLKEQEQTQEATEELLKKSETPEVTLLDDMPYPELRALAKERGIEGYYNMNTKELREALKEGE